MLNLKKGLALVLAAATAFTFAPVANLGAIDAKAGQVLDTSLTSIDIQKNATRDFKVKDLSQLANFDSTVTVIKASVDNDAIAKIVQLDPNNNNTPSGSAAKTAAIGAADFTTGKALIRIVAGKEIGQTKLHLESRNTSGTLIAQEDIIINVTDLVPNVTFDKSEVNFEKIGDQTFHTVGEADGIDYADVVATLVNGTLPDDVPQGDWKAESSDTKVVTVNDPDGHYSGSEALDANTLTPKGVGEATVTWTFTYKKGSVTHSVCAGTVKVKVTDSTDTLSVKYDPDRTGKADAENVSISTKPNAEATDMTGYVAYSPAVGTSWDSTQPYFRTDGATPTAHVDAVYKTGKRIVIDSVQNLTAKINISDSMGRAYTVRSDNNWIVVDNAGNITIANKPTGDRGASALMNGNITVNVPATTVNQKLVAAYTITIPVTVYDKEATSLQVNESVSNKLLGKTVGGTSGSDSFDEIPKLYLSTKDKKTSAIEFTTNSGDQYISVAVTDATSGQISDAVSYDAASKTLTALKAGKKAIVTVTCRNNADTYGEAIVMFGVEVVSKNANNIITTASETYNLTKSARTASIGAKSTYATTLKYELVKGIDSTETATSSDVTVDGNGNLSYTSNNKGTAYVRISGNDTADALAPADKYVTVQYGADKAASPLSVTTTQVTVDVDETAPIVATAGGIAVSYKSSDESVATVDANGVVTGKKAGSAFITVSAAETDDFKAGQTLVPVIVNGDKAVAPEKVTGLKVSNKKGAYVSVKWASQGKNINYRVWKKVGNGKWVGKNVAGNKTTLSVKKGAKVQVKVKAYVKDANGKTTWGPTATKAKTFKTDKK